MLDDDAGLSKVADNVQEHLAALFETAAARVSFEPTRLAVVLFNPAFAVWMREHYATEVRRGVEPEQMLPAHAAAEWRALLSRTLRAGGRHTAHVIAGDTLVQLVCDRLERDGTVVGASVRVEEASHTWRRRAPHAGIKSMRSLVHESPLAMAVVRGTDVQHVSDAYAGVFRASPDLMAGLPALEHWAPESRAEIAALLEKVRSEGGAMECEGRGVRRDGSTFPAHVTVGAVGPAESDTVALFLTDTTERPATETHLNQTLDELRRLKDRLELDNMALREQITLDRARSAIRGSCPAIVQVLEQARAVAPTDSVVLITGETGTGKELLARAIHEMSPRAARPIVTVNCAALPAGLIESELFGREKGAFTGASTRQQGRFESAHGSTLFLDEVAELPIEVQAKLLRVLQDGSFERLGSAHTVSVDVRVIAATNHDLGAMIESGAFRADLYYRLRVFPIEMPPLRARGQDIPLLVWDAVRLFSKKLGKRINTIPPETMRQLQQYSWPGNVRELRNLIERSVILSQDGTLTVAFDDGKGSPGHPPVSLAEAQRRHILAILEQTGWRVAGKDGAAARLELRRSTLNSLLKRLGISRPR